MCGLPRRRWAGDREKNGVRGILAGSAPSSRSSMVRRAPAQGRGTYSCFGSRRLAASSSSCLPHGHENSTSMSRPALDQWNKTLWQPPPGSLVQLLPPPWAWAWQQLNVHGRNPPLVGGTSGGWARAQSQHLQCSNAFALNLMHLDAWPQNGTSRKCRGGEVEGRLANAAPRGGL